jgi:hypothetical protein
MVNISSVGGVSIPMPPPHGIRTGPVWALGSVCDFGGIGDPALTFGTLSEVQAEQAARTHTAIVAAMIFTLPRYIGGLDQGAVREPAVRPGSVRTGSRTWVNISKRQDCAEP